MILSSPLSHVCGHRSINHDNGQTELRALKKHGSDEARTTQLTLIQYFLKCLRWNGKKPRFQEITRLPLIPIEAEIDALIAGSGWKTSAFLQLLKETAMRPGEAVNLTWCDLDLISKTVRVTPEKGSNPRIFAVSDKLLNMLLSIKERNQVRDPDRIFARQLRHIRRYFERVRKRQAFKLQNPRLKKIMLKTFRT